MQSSADGTRSRSGCFACRLRKRKCDGLRPVCTRCLRSRTQSPCEWPDASIAQFVVTVARNPLIPLQHEVKQTQFINLTANELPDLCLEYASLAVDPTTTDTLAASASSLIHQPSIYLVTADEANLIQYYTEVVSSSRVYVTGGANSFRTLVLPTILSQDGPLRSTILSLSSAERTRDSYDKVTLRYKHKALTDMQQTLSDPVHAGENLMACVLQASLEISSGSRPAWLRHLRGSIAIINAFASFIDDDAVKFALSYFYLRYNLLRTTLEPSSATGSQNEDTRHLEALAQETFNGSMHEMTGTIVDKHLGCSIELLVIISQISELSVELRAGATKRAVRERATFFDQRLQLANLTCVDSDQEYLLTSAETFKLAARIYLRLVCWKSSIWDEDIIQLEAELLSALSCVLGETQPRRSFPMWPLFLAGCVSSNETHRKAVADMFRIIDGKWPVSNISTVWRALRTIWQSRDFNMETGNSAEHQDWQQVIEKFRWRLALT